LLRTAIAGRPAKVPGDLDTVMACLSCGEVSVLAWRLLARGAAAFLAIRDDAAVTAMRTLARGAGDDPAIVAGESGAAGLAGLATAAADPEARAALALDGTARVLLFGTEGATDPQRYEALVGLSPAEVAS
jgi:diaminopropionate ammonia-lyase